MTHTVDSPFRLGLKLGVGFALASLLVGVGFQVFQLALTYGFQLVGY